MYTTRKFIYAAVFAMFLTLGAVQAQDALKMFRPETDAGREESYNEPVVEGSTFSHNSYDYGPADESRSDAIKMARPETDYGRVDDWDEATRSHGGAIEESRPVTDSYSYSEETE